MGAGVFFGRDHEFFFLGKEHRMEVPLYGARLEVAILERFPRDEREWEWFRTELQCRIKPGGQVVIRQ